MEPPAQNLRSCEEQVTERAKLALHRELVGGSGGLEVIASTLDSLGLTGSFPSRHTPAANSNVSTADTWRGPIVSPRFCSGLSMTPHLGKARMKNRLGFIKTTLVGGFFFLIAAVIIVFSFRQADWRIESIGQSSLSLLRNRVFDWRTRTRYWRDRRGDLALFCCGIDCQACKRQTHTRETRRHVAELLPRICFYLKG